MENDPINGNDKHNEKACGVKMKNGLFISPICTVLARTDKGAHFCAMRTCRPLQAVTKLLVGGFHFNPPCPPFLFFIFAENFLFFSCISIFMFLRRPKTAREFR